MKFLVALSCLLAVACAKPSVVAPVGYSYSTNVVTGHVASPVAYSSVAYSPVAHAVAAPVAHVAAPVARVAAPVAHVATHAVAAPVAQVTTHAVAAPVAHVATHAVAAPVVAAPVVQKTQYHAQNEIGQASYGHSEPLQVHNAVQDAAGNKVGSYSYVAPNGQVIAANYVADALGYRVSSNALPVAPSVVPVAPADTPEVVAARAAHLNEHILAGRRGRRSVVAAYHAPIVHHSYYTPVVRAATLTTVVNTPAHAVSYRVY